MLGFAGLSVIVLSCATVILVVALVFMSLRLLNLREKLSLEQTEVRVLTARLQDVTMHEDALRNAARAEFESLAARIVERDGRSLRESMLESSEKSLERLLTPLKERLREFEKLVTDSYQFEGRERSILRAEVERLIHLGERMTSETGLLAQALRGDSKTQGDWGEVVLERILESAGLREGVEFYTQAEFTNDEGNRVRPDVVVVIPDGKQIVIDAKVSLKAFEAYTHAVDDAERERSLKAHLASVSRHVDDLAKKHYDKLKSLRTPEFVFLFMPIEPAYILAMRHDPELVQRAWNKGVAIVTSTTLFASLRTVASIWRLEHQNRNAQEIADEAAKLYDKFVGFNEDFEKLGRTFESGLQQFSEARKKLSQGQGNVFRKIELLRELGAAPEKRLRPELLD